MRHIIKGEAPPEYEKWKRENPGKNYQDLEDDLRRLVRGKLIDEQAGLCAYCNCQIDVDSSHIDHVVQRRNAPGRQHDFTNMLASCKCNDTCGFEKDRQQDPLPLTPFSPNCEDVILYLDNGGISGANEDAKKSIDILNLHDENLVARRKAAIDGYVYNSLHPSEFSDLDAETLQSLLDELEAEPVPLSSYHSALLSIVRFHLSIS